MNTWLTSGMCRPRAATSVATSAASLPSWNSRSMRMRLRCGTSPDIAEATTPFARSRRSSRSARRLVLTNTSVRVAAPLRSRWTSSGSLLLHRRVVDHLAHALGGDALGLDANQLRVVHVLVGELEHAVRERRREQQVEAVLGRRQPAQQEADVLDEAEVEHAVGLVEDHDLRRAAGRTRAGGRSRSVRPGVPIRTSTPAASVRRCLS